MITFDKNKVNVDMLLGVSTPTHFDYLLSIIMMMEMQKNDKNEFNINDAKLHIKPRVGLSLTEAIKSLTADGYLQKTSVDKTYEVVKHPW